jgi:hypothetical protein
VKLLAARGILVFNCAVPPGLEPFPSLTQDFILGYHMPCLRH